MPFIIVFNIIILIIMIGVLLTQLGCVVVYKENAKRNSEKALKTIETTKKVRAIAYIVFFAAVVLMILVNLIF